MFGYVRPYKPELLVKELTRYQSVYCGICKQIGRDYGQVPRLALGYDGLVKSAAAGKNAMPPRGGAADLTDDELKRVVAFLANKAGAGFKAPE